MIVKIKFPNNYERMVECDTIHKNTEKDSFQLTMYLKDKMVEQPIFKDKVTIYVMENGRTVDILHFDPNPPPDEE